MSRKLGKKQIEEFKTAFIKQQQIIYNEYSEKKEELDVDGDETDLIQGNLLSSISEKLSLRDANKLAEIQNALRRIEDGTFGICIECDEQIGKARLLARPEAEYCIDCAERVEFEAKNFLNNS